MERIGSWLAGNDLPDATSLTEAAFAAGLAAAALLFAWFAGSRLGTRLSHFLAERFNGQAEAVRFRACAVLRWSVAAVLLAILAAAWPWLPLARLLVGVAHGFVVGMLASTILRALHMPRWAAWTLGTLAAVGVLSHAIGGIGAVEQTLDEVGIQIGARRLSLLSALTFGITILLLFAGVRLANRVIGHTIGQARGFDATQKLLFQKLVAIGVVVLAFFVGVDLLEIDLTAFAVFSGAFGLAVGFGLQKTIGNLIAGIILLMDRSIKPGDVIVVGDSFGWVNKIGVRAVSVITRDGKEHLIPNENLMTQEVENWSYTDRNVRVRIPVSVSYECDLDLAQELMLRAATESPRVLRTPKPNVWFTGFGENGLQHDILAWISDPESGVGNVKSDVLNRLWKLFREHGIEVPYPQRDIRVRPWKPTDAQ